MAGTVVIPNQGTVSASLLDWVRTLPSDVGLKRPRGGQIARQRNLGSHAGLAGDWVLFVDADSVPRAETLALLLSRNLPIVGAVVCERQPPWRVCAVKAGWTGAHDIQRVSLADLPRQGTLRVSAVGTGCLLVRCEVFKAVRFPWFRCGQIVPDLLMEDTGFCLDAEKAGIPTHLDCEARVGHDFGAGVVWPGRDGRPWIEWASGTLTQPVGPPAATASLEVAAIR